MSLQRPLTFNFINYPFEMQLQLDWFSVTSWKLDQSKNM